jgi:phosphate starvation-inducible protein PhoH
MARSISKKTVTRATSRDTAKPQRRIRIDDLKTVNPLTDNQRKVFAEYKDNKNLLLHGTAGTGKSFLSLYLALEEVLDPSSDFEKVVIVRSIVPTRDIGFLKGTEQEKIEIYEVPYKGICKELFSVSDSYSMLKDQGAIDFISTSFIRGTTLNNCIVIVDEMENLNFHELDSIITRLSDSSKILLCGDYTQTDLTRIEEKKGLIKFMRIIKTIKSFSNIEFGIKDIVRGTLVRDYIIAKENIDNL